MNAPVNRRSFCRSLALGSSALALGARAGTSASAPPERTSLGLVSYCFGLHQSAWSKHRQGKDLGDPLAMLEESHRLGAGGIQVSLGQREGSYLRELRRRAETLALRLEASIDPPFDRSDLERFGQQVTAAQEAGAGVARTVIMPGRRYEQFQTLDEFRRAAERGRRALELAEPVLAKHRFRLAVENHKDHRVPERLELLRQLSSEHIGLCVDVGNNFTLLEDPLEVVRAFAPWAFTVHLKDQAVREYAEGFLYGDAALGEGFLPLEEMVSGLRQARPDVTFNLEVITRDPLKVPVLTQPFWATLPDVPARDLSRTLQTVRSKSSPAPLPLPSTMTVEAQLALETQNLEQSLAYARKPHIRAGLAG